MKLAIVLRWLYYRHGFFSGMRAVKDLRGRIYEWCWGIGAFAVIVGVPWYFGAFDRDYGNKNLSDLINCLIFAALFGYWIWGTKRVVAQIRRDRQRARDFQAAKASGNEDEMVRLMIDRIQDT